MYTAEGLSELNTRLEGMQGSCDGTTDGTKWGAGLLDTDPINKLKERAKETILNIQPRAHATNTKLLHRVQLGI